MKTTSITTLLLFCLLQAQALHGQTQDVTSVTSEQSTNATLIQNSTTSREELENKDPEASKQRIRQLGPGQGRLDTTNLTDQEKQLSENYIHHGKANEIIKANCTGENASVCAGGEGNHTFLGMNPNMVKAVAQAYAVFGALAGDSLGSISKGKKALEADKPKTDKEKLADADAEKQETAQNESGENATEKKEKANDYCRYIPTATEGIATAVQMTTSNQLLNVEASSAETAQKDTLLKAAKSHDSRAKMAQVQAAGWWGGAACYAANAATGQFAVDKNLIIKMGAATLLGAFYQNEVSANKDYASKTRAVAAQLPGKGDCNPITDNLCYCSQPSTENDPEYCLKGLHKKTLAKDAYRIACTDMNLKLDPTCSCENTNTCFDTLLEAQGQGTLELGGLAYTGSPFKSIRSLARGELAGGTINSNSYAATSAIAKRNLRELASKIPSDGLSLTKDQKALADAMVAQGLPANVAGMMAQSSVSSGELNRAMASLSGSSPTSAQGITASAARSNVLEFSGGNGLGVGGQRATGKEDNTANELLEKLKGNKKGQATNSKLIEFAQKAEEQARARGQIRQDNTSIFDVISLRYQVSGRQRLEVAD